MSSDRFSHHGVFTHQYNSFSAEFTTDRLHLFRANIVSSNDEAFWIFFKKLDDAGEVISLPSGPVFFDHLCESKIALLGFKDIPVE